MALRNLTVVIGGDAKQLDKELQKSLRATKQFSQAVARVGATLTRYVTVPIVGFGAAALYSSDTASKAFLQFSERTKKTLGHFGDEIAKSLSLDKNLSKIASFAEKVQEKFASMSAGTKAALVTTGLSLAAIGPGVQIFADALTTAVNLSLALKNKLLPAALLVKGGLIALGAAAVAAGGAILYSYVQATKQAAELQKKQEELIRGERLLQHEAGARTRETGRAVRETLEAEDRRQQTIEALDALNQGNNPPPRGMRSKRPRVLEQEGPALEAIQRATDAYRTSPARAELEKLRFAHEDLWRDIGTGFEMLTQKVAEPFTAIVENVTSSIGQVQTFFEGGITWSQLFQESLAQIPPVMQEIVGETMNLIQGVSSGLGNALAQIIVYGENARDVFKALGKQILATVISTVVRIIVERLLLAVVNLVTAAGEVSGVLGGYAALTYAATYSSISAIPIVGPALAPGLAKTAVGAMIGGAVAASSTGFSAGKSVGAGIIAGGATGGGYLEGGISTTPQIAAMSEHGDPEIHLTKRNVRKFLAPDGQGGQRGGDVYLDRRKVGEILFPDLPGFLALHGVRL